MTSTDLIGVGWRFPVEVDGRGSIALSQGASELEQAIEIILNTPVGQRVMRPEFGCRIHDLVFAPINAGTFAAARHHVEEALAYWEPRIAVEEVRVEPDEALPSCLLVYIRYRVTSTYDQRALVYPFYTIPGES